MPNRRTLLITILIIASSLAVARSDQKGQKQSATPEFNLPQLSSQSKVSLADLKGKIIYLDFWATWCSTCKLSLPWLNELQSQYSKEHFEIIAINVDKEPAKAQRFLSQSRLSNLTVLTDPQADTARDYQIPSFPYAILIDRQGAVLDTFKGFSSEHQERLRKHLERLL